MPKFEFDATKHEARGRDQDSPMERALRIWFDAVEFQPTSLSEYCARAAVDRDTFLSLKAWARLHIHELGTDDKAMLADALLGRDLPKKTRKDQTMPTDLRNAIIRRIGVELKADFGLALYTREFGVSETCADIVESMMSDLGIKVGKDHISDILSDRIRRGK